MKQITPNYYDSFHCIADKCHHNCCIGWEIDIDDDTMQKYMSLKTPLGQKIRDNVCGENPHFILGENDRCPFLNDNNLCEIICEMGEEALCDICHLHPRFLNYYDDFVEIGIGLCCEEAARLVLCREEKFKVEFPYDAELSEQERVMLNERCEILNLLQNREMTIEERFCMLASRYGLEFSYSLEAMKDFYMSLERLDEKWTEELTKLDGFAFDKKIFCDDGFAVPFEQLACYIIYRYFSQCMYSGFADALQVQQFYSWYIPP